ncbi:MAG: hypothetical protein ACJAVI_004821 [Candidatus Azotimanducaceae bacterium]|jgi:hypothetical protein
MTEKTFCCETALKDDASLPGTAVHVDVWILLEYAYAWKDKAMEDNLLPSAVSESFKRLTEEFTALGLKLRVQLIKQASSELQSPKLFFADGRDSETRLMTSQLNGYDTFPLLSATQLLEKNVTGFTPYTDEIYLICTNGQRDVCCSRFGRPLYRKLHEHYGDRIWQTTHLGGHRYAPNLLCLPTGYVYGFVDPTISEELVENHDNKVLDINRLRGRSHYTPHAQAAEIFVRQQHNLVRNTDISCGSASLQNEESSVQYSSVNYKGKVEGEIYLRKEALPNTPTSCEPTPKPRAHFTRQSSN